MRDAAPTILVASDGKATARLVLELLAPDFGRVLTALDPDSAAQAFDRQPPDVLVLAFGSLEQAQRCNLGLYRQSREIHRQPHRTLVLCREEDLRRAYELCRTDVFDDYVLFWPQPADPLRLLMAVHHAARDLDAQRNGGPAPAEVAAQVRRLAELEAILSRGLAAGGPHLEATKDALARAAEDLATAFQGQGDVTAPLQAVSAAFEPLSQWVGELRQANAPLSASIRSLGTLAEGFQPTVLAVDDDPFQLKLVASHLAGEGYRLVCAASGIEALNMLRKTRPDVVLMDISMPDMDGLEVTRRMKGQDRFRSIPIIMVTGNSEELVVTDCLNAGADNFMVKPLTKPSLLNKLRKALAAKETR